MKYESTILKRLIDTYGVIGNPRYISEIIKEFIVRGKELYPQLFTYQSDWLAHIDEFGLTPEYTVSYTGQHIYAPNTLERPVKSAILKGNTLVNLVNYKGLFDGREINSDGNFKIDTTKPFQELIIGKEYTFIVYVSQTAVGNISEVAIEFNDKDTGNKMPLCVIKSPINGVNKVNFKVPSNYGSYRHSYIKTTSVGGSITIKGMVIEGNHTQEDIPYFTGMQSVKMPVLMVYNQENLFKNYIKDGSEWGSDYNCTTTDVKYSQNGGYVKIIGGSSLCYSGFVSPMLSRGTYKFSCKVKVGQVGDSYRILVHDNPNGGANNANGFASDDTTSTKEIETFEYVGYFRNANNMLFYTFYKGQEIEYYDIMFTKISDDNVVEDYQENPQKYEYKTNILTVNEEVTLRGIGDVRDELDCLTGEVTERIGCEYFKTLNWSKYTYNESERVGYTQFIGQLPLLPETTKALFDMLPTLNYISDDTKSNGMLFEAKWNTTRFRVSISNDLLSTPDVDGLLKLIGDSVYLITKDKEAIKTVDLTILDQNGQSVDHLKSFNGGTHVYTSSLEGSLVPSVDISLVTNLEETLKICSLEGNTM